MNVNKLDERFNVVGGLEWEVQVLYIFFFYFGMSSRFFDLIDKLVEIFSNVSGLVWEVGNDCSADGRAINLIIYQVVSVVLSDYSVITCLDLIINLRQRFLFLDAGWWTRRHFNTILRWWSIYCCTLGSIKPRCYSMGTTYMGTTKSITHSLHFK